MKRLNNKILALALLLLLSGFILVKMFRSPGLESNLDEDLLSIDTAAITTIRLYPVKAQRKEVNLVREGTRWKVRQDQKTADVATNALHNMLGSIRRIKAERIVSRKKEKWDAYQVGDTTGTHVLVLSDNKTLADLWIGKTHFTQGGGSTYVRLGDEAEVYAVEGYLASSFDKTFNDWRDKTFLRAKKDSISKITFRYPADSSFVLEKKDYTWRVGNERADSVAVDKYLNNLISKDLFSFADQFTPAGEADVVLTIENAKTPGVTVKAWKNEDANWVLTSTLRPGVYFSGEGSSIVKDLFIGKGDVLHAAQ